MVLNAYYLHIFPSIIKFYKLNVCETYMDYPEDHDLSLFIEMSSYKGVESVLWL